MCFHQSPLNIKIHSENSLVHKRAQKTHQHSLSSCFWQAVLLHHISASSHTLGVLFSEVWTLEMFHTNWIPHTPFDWSLSSNCSLFFGGYCGKGHKSQRECVYQSTTDLTLLFRGCESRHKSVANPSSPSDLNKRL